jgi:PAS domain S-box-containing protein
MDLALDTTGWNLDFPKEYLKAALMVSLLSVWVLVGLFFYLNRYTRRRYFTIWTAAWLCYAFWLTLNLGVQSVPGHPLPLLLKQWCLGATAVFLLWGSAEFLEVRARELSFSLFTAFLFLWSYLGVYQLDNVLPAQLSIFGLIGAASLLTAACFFKFRRQNNYVGAGLLAGGFTLWGVYLAVSPLFQRSDQLVSAGFFISAVLQLFIAVSMIVLVLEEARSFNRSVCERVRTTEWENLALQSRAASSEERYRSLFDQAAEAIIITDATDYRILELNPAAARLLGVNREHPGNLELTGFCRWPDPARVRSYTRAEWLERICETGRITVVGRDGRTTPVEAAGSRVQYEGRLACQFCFREITERLKLEQQLRQSEKLSALGRMISGVAHELNNPLAVVKGYSELILASHQLAPGTRADLEKVAYESNRAARLVSNFLTFARENTSTRASLDLNVLVRQVTSRNDTALKGRGIQARLELDPHLPRIRINADQIEQVLVILLTNARQAMSRQRGARSLQLRTLRKGELIQLCIEDNGPGVPEALVARIFEPFFTTKAVGEGTGLGLSIAHSIMADHHGRIFYRRSPLGGAGFVLEFPLVEVNGEVAAPREPEAAPKSARKSAVAPARILVVDDEAPLAEMIAEFLKLHGHDVTVCFHPTGALENIAAGNFDLILSDFRMPGMSGADFFHEIERRWPKLASRVIFLTGDLVNDDTHHFLGTVGNPHLTKPFNLSSVEQVVNNVLKRGETAAA